VPLEADARKSADRVVVYSMVESINEQEQPQ
jgi:hypothetical protein